MMKTRTAIGALCIGMFLIISISPCLAQPDTCLVDTLLINTGYNHRMGSIYAVGSLDRYWTVVEEPANHGGIPPRPAHVISPLTPGWAAPLTNTRWLASRTTADNGYNGIYVFEYEFCMGCTTGARLCMDILVDDDAVVKLNNYPIGQTPVNPSNCTVPPQHCNFRLPPVNICTVNSNLFLLGKNKLTVEVNNRWCVAMGLNISGYVTGACVKSNHCCDSTGVLYGYKWRDQDRDGIRQPNEVMVMHRPIHLSNGMNTMTDIYGYYYFMDIPPGNYTVSESPEAGWLQSYPLTPGSHSVTLAAYEMKGDLNFGNYLISTAVQLASFTAAEHDDYITVEWTTEAAINTAGFNLYRSLSEDGDRSKLNQELIPAQGNELQSARYSFIDNDVTGGVTCHYWLEEVNVYGTNTVCGHVLAAGKDHDTPAVFGLSQNYPNPFNPTTEIRYELAAGCHVLLEIYDALGHRVATLVNEYQNAGSKVVRWDAHSKVSSGAYFCRLKAGDFVKTRKMVILR